MARKKQRRRREKERRHDWEYVYVDDEGKEVDVEVEESDAEPSRRSERKTGEKRAPARSGRKVEPPSWRRVMRRALIFSPFMLAVVWLLKAEADTFPAVAGRTVMLIAIFIPFSYLMDSMMYRAFRKRTGGDGGDRAKRR